jgi:Flp pilus assembly protein TadG
MNSMHTHTLSILKTRHRRSEGGMFILIFAACVAVLLGFLGLAFDASYMYFYKRRMQTAADAGAIAGAQELNRGSADATVGARKDTSLNRFTHQADGIDVAVNNPPLSGSRAGDASFVEVIITQTRPTWFLRIVGADSATIRARAVAGLTSSDGCVYVLNRDTSNVNNGVFVNGTTNSTFACSVFSNSNFRAVGGGCLIATGASYSGTYTNSSSGDSDCGPDVVGHGVPVADPMDGRYSVPGTSPCAFNNYKETASGPVTLTPGIYCGGIDIGGNVSTATFSAGTYVLVGGGLKISSGATATGTGVTFFNTFPDTQTNKYDAVTINTSGTVAFSAPTAGTTRALLFWQDPRVPWASNNGSTITGGSNSSFEGILYFPTTDLTYSGNSSSSGSNSGYTSIVAYNLKINGSAQINGDYSSIGGSSPFQKAAFAE